MELQDGEWELSKENIKPLKQGRQMTSLKSVLDSPRTLNDRLREEQSKFELEIRTYDGPDALGVWYEYIQWIQQNYPKGGPHGNLFQVVHSCCTVFTKKERYFNDERFLDIWMKCINMSTEPLVLFDFMHINNLCCKLASFYINWALEMEKFCDFKKTDAIYVEGINRNAEPIDLLKTNHKQFLMRLSLRIHEDVESYDNNTDVNQRHALNALPVKSKKAVPSNRAVENARGLTKAPIKSSAILENSKCRYKMLEVESEESVFPIQPCSDVKTSLNVNSDKENQIKPGKWNENKLKRKPGTGPISVVNQERHVGFVFHEDTEEEQQKMPKIPNQWTRVLSEKKPEVLGIPATSSDNPKIKIMYCKEMLFVGGQEFQFEEIRAARYIARQKAKQLIVDSVKDSATPSDAPMPIQTVDDQVEKMRTEIGKLNFVDTQQEVAAEEIEPEVSNSPTVHTRAALNEMLSLFNGTIDVTGSDSSDDSIFEIPTPKKVFPAFTIYSENEIPSAQNPVSQQVENRDVTRFNFQNSGKEDQTMDTVQFQFSIPDTDFTLNCNLPENGVDFDALAKFVSTPLQPIKDKSASRSDSALSKSDSTPLQPIKDKSASRSDSVLSKSDSTPQDSIIHKPTHYIEPFNREVQRQLLEQLTPPLSSYTNVTLVNFKLPQIECGKRYDIGGTTYEITAQFTGGYATLFKARGTKSNVKNRFSALKVQKPECSWEFYITTQLKSRLQKLKQTVNVIDSFGYFTSAHIYNDGSILENEWANDGTLLDANNCYIKSGELMPEVVVLYFALELVNIMQQMHACQIIHGDIKPDNILLSNLNSLSVDPYADCAEEVCTGKTTSLQLIDFGQSVDTSLFPPGTRFRQTVNTEDFICPEMRDNREWTYQIDYYGLAATLQCLLFGKYSTIEKVNGSWRFTSQQLKRYWQKEFWSSFFEEWLNIPSCDQLPDLGSWKSRFQEAFYAATKMKGIIMAIRRLQLLVSDTRY